MSQQAIPRLERLPSVMARTGLSKTTIYGFIRDGKFPAPVPLTSRTCAWDEAAVSSWIANRIAAGSNAGKAA